MSKGNGHKILAENRKAFHDYEILTKYTAGIVLTGTEIKSIRSGRVNLKDGFVRIDDGEVWLYNVHISPYENGNRFNHDPLRVRKLLLNKQEINKLIGKTKESGLAIVPINIHLSCGFAKVEIIPVQTEAFQYFVTAFVKIHRTSFLYPASEEAFRKGVIGLD